MQPNKWSKKLYGTVYAGMGQTRYMHSNTFRTFSDRYNCRNIDEDTLVRLSRKLECPPEDILRAVQEVGPDLEEVAEYIRDRYNRC